MFQIYLIANNNNNNKFLLLLLLLVVVVEVWKKTGFKYSGAPAKRQGEKLIIYSTNGSKFIIFI